MFVEIIYLCEGVAGNTRAFESHLLNFREDPEVSLFHQPFAEP
jgi:hypothetical protein